MIFKTPCANMGLFAPHDYFISSGTISFVAKINVSLSNDSAKIIQDIAIKEGKTMSSLITESVSLYAWVKEVGFSKSRINSLILLQEILRAMKAIPVPSSLLEFFVSSAVESHENATREALTKRGRMLGEFVKVYASTLDDMISLVKEQAVFLPTDKIEIRRDDKNLELVITGCCYGIGSLEILTEGIKGFLSVYDVNITEQHVSEGFIKLKGKI